MIFSLQNEPILEVLWLYLAGFQCMGYNNFFSPLPRRCFFYTSSCVIFYEDSKYVISKVPTLKMESENQNLHIVIDINDNLLDFSNSLVLSLISRTKPKIIWLLFQRSSSLELGSWSLGMGFLSLETLKDLQIKFALPNKFKVWKSKPKRI